MVHHFAAFGQDFYDLTKLFISDLEHVQEGGEEGWADLLLTEHNITVYSIHCGAILKPHFFQGGHEECFMLAGAEVVPLSNLIVLQYEEGIFINKPDKIFVNSEGSSATYP